MRNARGRQPAPEQVFETRGVVGRVVGVALRRPVDGLAGALAVACTAMILYNALVLQQGGRNGSAPASSPHVSSAVPAPPAKPQQWSAAAPLRDELVAQVQSALAGIGAYDGPQDGLMGARTAAAIRSFEISQKIEPTGEASERVLAAAMVAAPRKASDATPAAKPTTPPTTGSTVATPKLAAAQKALASIGYAPGAVDGRMGAGTRAAIQTFERDHKLPETGELTPPTVRALQSVSGARF